MRQFEEPQHLVVFTDSDSTGNANKKLQETMNTKNLTETIIIIYNTKQLVDNMNKLIDDENVDDTFNMKECDAMTIETNNEKKSRRRCTILIVGVLHRSWSQCLQRPFSGIEPHSRNPRLLILWKTEDLSDEGHVSKRLRARWQSPKVHGRTWRKCFGIGTFSARAIVDHRPLTALLVQEGLINNHPFITVF